MPEYQQPMVALCRGCNTFDPVYTSDVKMKPCPDCRAKRVRVTHKNAALFAAVPREPREVRS